MKIPTPPLDALANAIYEDKQARLVMIAVLHPDGSSEMATIMPRQGQLENNAREFAEYLRACANAVEKSAQPTNENHQN